MIKKFLNNTQVGVFVLLVVLGLVSYANVLSAPFVHDDILFIKDNPDIQNFNFKQIFFRASSIGQDIPIANNYYRPLLDLAYRVQYAFFGSNPIGYHLVNILCHVLNAFMIFLILRLIYPQGLSLAIMVAVLFLLHPVQNEAVACISGISNLLYSFFVLLSVLFYLFPLKKDVRYLKRFLYGLASCGFFILALLSKEQSVILPLLLVLFGSYVYKYQDKVSLPAVIVPIAGQSLVLILYFAWRKIIFSTGVLSLLSFDGEFKLRVLSIPRTLITYLSLIFWPHHLHYYRNTDILKPYLGSTIILLLLAALCLFAIFSIKESRLRRLVFLGMGWFVIALLPVMNFVPIINEYSFILTAEHFLYLPLFGIILLSLGIIFYYSKFFKDSKFFKFRGAVVIILLILCLLINIKQNAFWSSEINLFSRTVQFEKDFGRGHHLLANAYYYGGYYDEAIRHHRKALEIFGEYRRKAQGKQAKIFYTDYIKKIKFDLAHVYESLGKWDRAAEEYRSALAISPEDSLLHKNIGVIYFRLRKYDEAIRHFKEAIRLDPDDLWSMNNLAVCYLEVDKKEEARKILEQVLDRDPHFESVRRNLNRLLSK